MPKIRQPEPPAYTPPPRPQPRPQPQQPRPQIRLADGPATVVTSTAPARPSRPRLRRLIRVTASLVALAAIGVASWQLVSTLNKTERNSEDGQVQPPPSQGGSATPVAPAGKPVAIAGVVSFNPLGDGPEHAGETQLAYDGDLATSWQTSGYNQDLGGAYKAGTGLLVDLGSVQQVGSVQVQFAGTTKVELRAAPAGSTPETSKAGLESLGTAVATQTGSTVELKPGSALSTRYLLLWLTGLPKDGSDNQYRGKIAEVKVTS
ncbi:hypothetical protein ACFQ0T_19730 [Kitasatospora gansuensis]